MQRFGTVARTMNGAKGTNNFLLVGFKKLTDGNRLSGQTCWIGSVLVASSWPLISVWSKDSAEVAAEVVDSPESDKCCWRSESVLAISICSSSAAKIRNSSSSLLLTERVNEFNVKYVDFLSIHDKDSNYNSEKKRIEKTTLNYLPAVSVSRFSVNQRAASWTLSHRAKATMQSFRQ